MKLPRDVAGLELARALTRSGYQTTRQTGSHIRLTLQGPPQQHLTIPAHADLKLGTLSAILTLAEAQLNLGREELLKLLSL